MQRGLNHAHGFDVIAGGVGPAATAAATARQLVQGTYDWVISAGIAGGFAGRAEVSSIVIADTIIAADLGSETEDGFSSVQELGFGTDRVQADPDSARKLAKALQHAGVPVTLGPVLTVSTTTGTAATAHVSSIGYRTLQPRRWRASAWPPPPLQSVCPCSKSGPFQSGRSAGPQCMEDQGGAAGA